MNAINLLTRDHSTVKKLFRQIENGGSLEEKLELFRKIQKELTVHTKIEEEIFYPALKAIGTEEAREYYEEAQEEHAEAKKILRELSRLDPSDEHFLLNLGKLIQGVEHHAKEEEEGMFPVIRKRIPKNHLETLGAEMEERKLELSGETPRSTVRRSLTPRVRF